jgi:putative serine protease PepD
VCPASTGDDRANGCRVRLAVVEPDEGFEDEGPFFAWVPPDDRLWRHPSEVHGEPGREPAGIEEHGGLTSFSLVSAASGPKSHLWTRAGTRTWTVALVAGLAGALCAWGIGVLSGSFTSEKTVVRSIAPDAPLLTVDPSPPTGSTWTAIAEAVAPSVVSLQVSNASGVETGSGLMLVDGEQTAYLVTDSSFVAGGGSIEVTSYTGEQDPGRLVGNDPVTDLALIAVSNRSRVFPSVGSVADLQVAGPVLAIGSRLASEGSVFPGTVAAEDQEVDLTGDTSMQGLITISGGGELPQVSAGGPLVDASGRVVGITVSLNPVDTYQEAMSFAVPIDVAMQVATQLLSGHPPSHPWLGVLDATDVPGDLASRMGVRAGAQVGAIWPGSPAARAGIQANDIVTSINGKVVSGAGSLTAILARCQENQKVPVYWVHLKGGQPVQMSATVSLSNQPTAALGHD